MRRQAHREKCIFKFKGLNGKYICSILWSLGYISKTIILLHYKYFKSNTLQVKKLKKGYCPFCCHRFIKNNCTNGHGRLPPFHGNKSLFRNYKRTWPIFIRKLRIALSTEYLELGYVYASKAEKPQIYCKFIVNLL